ncbi:metallophosphoesterase [Natronomonas sp. LN261]|uniref:metallophosphoesterase family protein n=1 Tax=Natronomonas sp. LN261 TaxID=2750669 RepID=UPI0015EEE743|nr:metallophosphoesterase family protein [Natronomonas sp. LN261]
MKVGLISDVHANLPALEAVLADLPDVDRTVCAGDVVGYNPWPAACVDRIRSVASVTVRGNHDRMVDTPHRYVHNEMAHAGLEYAEETLSTEQREWLRTRPERVTVADGAYLLTHSHPDPKRRDSYVYPEGFADLRPHLEEYDGLILGHTHIQHGTTVDGRVVVNPGSVGQPRDGDPEAAYAVLDTAEHTVELRRTAYDIDRVKRKIATEGLPTETGERLAQGR